MTRILRLALPLVIAGAAATALFAESHEQLDPAVKARQSHMTLYSHNLGILGNMAQGNTEYDAAAASAAAANLAALAALDQTSYWKEDTDSEFSPGSRALPAIWENMADFETKEEGLANAAAEMASVAGGGLESVQANMQALGGACAACHREYRVRDN